MTTSRSTKRTQKSDDNEAGLVHSIYRISLGKLFGDQESSDTSLNRKEFDEIKDRFFQEINAGKNEPCEQYQEYEMREDKATSTKAAFYVKCVKADTKEFTDFYLPLLSDKEALNGFLKDNEPKYLSTILLLQTSEKRLYAITSGFARYSIQSIVEKNFGLKVLNSEIENVRVSGRTVHPLEGVVQSLQENFNQHVNVNSIITNTELISKITGKLEGSKLLDNLSDSKKKKSCTVAAMDQIRVGIKVPFASLCQFLQYLDKKVGDAATIEKISGINRVGEKATKKIWDVIFQKFVNVKNNTKDDLGEVYIFPPGDLADTYLEANKYKLSHTNLGDDSEHEITEIPLLLKEIISWIGNVDQEAIEDLIDSVRISFIGKDEYDKRRKIPLKSCLNGYVKAEDGRTYILRYGELFEYPEFMVKNLKKDIGRFLKDIQISGDIYTIKGKFSKKAKEENVVREETTNKERSVENDVLDAICESGQRTCKSHKLFLGGHIELADLVTLKDGKFYFTHVKRNFDCNMRVLQKQIEISIRKLVDILRSDEKERIFKEYAKGCGKPRCSFKSIEENNVEYVVGIIVKEKKEEGKAKPLDTYIMGSNSVPALLCLNELYEFCFRRCISLRLLLIVETDEHKFYCAETTNGK